MPNHLAVLSTLTPRPRGVLFDYGNTLIQFGQGGMGTLFVATQGGAARHRWPTECLSTAGPGPDPARLFDSRHF